MTTFVTRAFLMIGLIVLSSCAYQPRSSGGINAEQHLDKPYLVLISLDGYRWDYPKIYHPPTVARMFEQGFSAERLIPVFPTITFPNHYSIATGVYPERHGIVANDFYAPALERWYTLRDRSVVEDGRFYGAEPIWVTAERQGMVSAAFFFVGTEADIGGVHPSYWYSFNKKIPAEERIDQVVAWLSQPPATRPHLITLYFEDVDDHSHWYGVESDAAAAAVQRVDEYLARLMQAMDQLPHGDQVNILVVSDHGQSGYGSGIDPLILEEHIDLEGVRVAGRGSYSFLYYDESSRHRAKSDQAKLRSIWQGRRVLTPAEAPPEWRVGDNPRWPQLIIQPDPGGMVTSYFDEVSELSPGMHGWAPEHPDMHGVLFGVGPAFRAGARVGAIDVVDVYPLMLSILGLQGPKTIDGNPEVLTEVLAEE